MDTQMEDKYVQLIEKSLSQQMDDQDLFTTGKQGVSDLRPRTMHPVREIVPIRQSGELIESKNLVPSLLDKETLAEVEHVELGPIVTRAEYIRQAREACLRQMSETKYYVQQNQLGIETPIGFEVDNSRTRNRDTSFWMTEKQGTQRVEHSSQELISYRSLAIRTICAIAICIAIIIFDILEVKIGMVSKELVREYVVGKDYLKAIEQVITTFIQK